MVTALRFGARGVEGFLLGSIVSPCKEIRTGLLACRELRKVVSSPEEPHVAQEKATQLAMHSSRKSAMPEEV